MKKLSKFSLILAIVSLLVSGLYAGTTTKTWERTYGGSKDDGAKAIVKTKDGGFIVAGGTSSFGNGWGDIYLIKIYEK